jgi:hypothetical protein
MQITVFRSPPLNNLYIPNTKQEQVHVDVRLLKKRGCTGLESGLRGSVDSLRGRVVFRTLKRRGRWNGEYALDGAMPDVPSAFLACHQFPVSSVMSRISFWANEISFGSLGEAVSGPWSASR